MKWNILHTVKTNDVVDVLLKNRGIETKKEREEFFDPTPPFKLSLKSLGIDLKEVKKAVKRIKKAKVTKEKVFVYGDYDADGVCATAIMWETLHKLGLQVLPYIPERFSEGYGLNIESIKKLKEENPDLGLIITVDHGIVADTKVDLAKTLGIDVIITDHHQPGKIKPKPYALIHTTSIGGAGVAWILSRELGTKSGLELAAIGTIADQLPLIGANRSLVKYGLKELAKTNRPGLLALFRDSGIKEVGTYEVGFIIAPRLNAMGRLGHAIDSLRLLCTKDKKKADEFSTLLTKTNIERQKIVEEVALHARKNVTSEKIIVLSHESYHGGVIGLAAGRLVEEFYRPSIVISKKGDIAKGSARSVSGFNIIEAIRKLDDLIIEGGGHPMAAGFSIETSKIEIFTKRINELGKKQLTDELLEKKMRVDVGLEFNQINWKIFEELKKFEPAGLGNPQPTFVTKGVEVVDSKTVGQDKRHLKLRLRQGEQLFDAIYFGGGQIYSDLTPDSKVDLVYQLEDNTWNNHKSLQLKVRDLKII